MPQRKNAVKRLRQDKKRHAHNLKLKDDLKKAVKKLRSLIAEKNKEEAKAFFKKLTSQLDRAIFKRIVHQNRASRLKSRLSKKLAGLA
jgi:small subunit ribosomal protein S20